MMEPPPSTMADHQAPFSSGSVPADPASGSGNGEAAAGQGKHGPRQQISDPYRGTGWRVGAFVAILAVGLAGLYEHGRQPRAEANIALAEAASKAEQQPPAVNVVQPVPSPRDAALTLPGQTQAFYDTTIYARVSGYLSHWKVDIGDRVKEGQLLATIETPELDQQLAEAKAKVGALKADVRYAEAQLDFAKLTSDRWDAAAPDGAVSKQERDSKAAEFKTARSRLEAAQAQLELGNATVKRLESELSFKQVTAPFSGTITQRHIDIGSLITAGSTAATTPLFAISQSDQIRVFVDVPQAAAPDIRVGMSAHVDASEYPGRAFKGTVDRTSDTIDPASRTLKVEVLVPNSDLTLRPGMYVEVSFELVRRNPPLLIRAAALNLRERGPQVAVVDAENHVHFQDIKIARDLGESVEVAEGLQPGQWLAVNISDEIAEGDTVRPIRLTGDVAHAPAGTEPAPARGSPAALAKTAAAGLAASK